MHPQAGNQRIRQLNAALSAVYTVALDETRRARSISALELTLKMNNNEKVRGSSCDVFAAKDGK